MKSVLKTRFVPKLAAIGLAATCVIVLATPVKAGPTDNAQGNAYAWGLQKNRGGGGGGSGGGAGPLPVLGATLLGQSAGALGLGAMWWRRRQKKKQAKKNATL